VIDPAAIGAALLPAVRDRGSIAITRGNASAPTERGISYVPVNVHDYDGHARAPGT
jgi:hypothetical protein